MSFVGIKGTNAKLFHCKSFKVLLNKKYCAVSFIACTFVKVVNLLRVPLMQNTMHINPIR